MRQMLCLLSCLAGSGLAVAAELVVPGDFATIQAAIDAAAIGDVVVVDPGTYRENVSMRSEIALRGREAARTLLGPDAAGPTILVGGVQDVTITNLTIVDSTVGLRIENAADVRIANVVFDGASTAAIDIDISPSVEISNCVFFENAAAIVRLTGDPEIFNNLFVSNAITVVSPVGLPGSNIEFNGFFDNGDLRQDLIDTALGTDFQIGDPEFVDPAARDFHVRAGSLAIDRGTGMDGIDDTVADLGAYGGPDADARPFPVGAVTLRDTSAASPPPYALTVSWEPNLDYRVASEAMPGGYRLYYRQTVAGPPYDGVDAGGGTLPSPVAIGLQTSVVLDNLAPQVDTPEAPRLLSAESRNEAIVLTWSAVPQATGYRIAYGVAAADQNVIDVGGVTGATVTGLANGTTYRFAVAATRRPEYHVAVTAHDGTQDANESAFSANVALPLGPLGLSVPSNELTATPEVTVPVPDLPDEGCFVATAAYGAGWQPQVEILRDFRDRILSRIPIGRQFVRWYYERGPRAAAYLSEHASLKPVVRAMLSPIVLCALVLMAASPVQKLLLAVLLLALLPVPRRGRKSLDVAP